MFSFSSFLQPPHPLHPLPKWLSDVAWCAIICPKAESMTEGAPKHGTPGLNASHRAVKSASESTRHRTARLASTTSARHPALACPGFPLPGERLADGAALRSFHSAQTRARYSSHNAGFTWVSGMRPLSGNITAMSTLLWLRPGTRQMFRGLLKTGMHGTFVFAHSLEPSTVPTSPLPPNTHTHIHYLPKPSFFFFFTYLEEIWKAPEIGSHSQCSILSIVSPSRGV